VSLLEPPIAPRPEFADDLFAQLVSELERPASSRLGLRTILLAAAILLLLAAVATATYLKTRTVTGSPKQQAELTAIQEDMIVALTPSGRRVIWRCRSFCGDPTGLDWSRDGRRLALTLDELGGRSANVGLHIVDFRTGRDVHLPRFHLAHPELARQPGSVLVAMGHALKAQIGCALPQTPRWAPNGGRLAVGCFDLGAIVTIGPDGQRPRLLKTGTPRAFSPTWSPNGTRIAYATERQPVEVVGVHPTDTLHSKLYVAGLDGRHRRLLARDAAAPDWSPTGSVIAYQGERGVRLITAAGSDVTPIQGLPRGVPSFSPDGKQLAIANAHVVLVVDLGDWSTTTLSMQPVGGVFGIERPAWYPGPRVPIVRRATQGCATCF
jgi:dipeptidyl aminopeptidase/acylaminoacyl peptidase